MVALKAGPGWVPFGEAHFCFTGPGLAGRCPGRSGTWPTHGRPGLGGESI